MGVSGVAVSAGAGVVAVAVGGTFVAEGACVGGGVVVVAAGGRLVDVGRITCVGGGAVHVKVAVGQGVLVAKYGTLIGFPT